MVDLFFHAQLRGRSCRSKTHAVKDLKRQAWYLSKYLSKEDFERYHFSGGWVFVGWIGFSRWVKKEFGRYPKKELLIGLGRMNKVERREHPLFWLYLWEKAHRVGKSPVLV